MTAPAPITIRSATPQDLAAWRPLWDGYNAFYGRFGATALPKHITETTWQRFHDPAEPVFCLVAQDTATGELQGLAHCVFHRSMTRIEPVCYLSDLFTRESARGRGVGRALINGVYGAARAAGSSRVYWQTHETNAAGRLLYDKLAKNHGFIVYSQEL
ncbi:GNAT family N-acetyltransferase [Acidovorax sp.]|uniref:GNAT family N-acetyltransferase n=1 Tax=Acidovorax sp. TaxID=1872122 RepID=UPI002612552D|nr:GNAT family N-acetyltransferase [Acidovorax sp.]